MQTRVSTRREWLFYTVTKECQNWGKIIGDPQFCKGRGHRIHRNKSKIVLKQNFLNIMYDCYFYSNIVDLQYCVGCFIVYNMLLLLLSWLQSCPTLCDPIDGSPPGSPVPGLLQARTLEWVAFSFSNACKWKVKVKSLSRVQLFATPWTADHQASPSMGFSRQEYWSGVPLPSPRIF